MFVIDILSKANEMEFLQKSTDGEYYKVGVEVKVGFKGRDEILITELVAILDSLEEKAPKLWSSALDKWLKTKGV